MTTKTGNLGLGSLEKWDIATTKKFLKLYRNYRCLWDHTDAAYKDKAERQNALESIANSMNIQGFDSRYVVLKVRALRSTYLYERRKVRLRLKNGEKFQTHLGWFHLADSFLRNYVVEKAYLHGDTFKDPNKDLPPPVDLNPFENSSKDKGIALPKDETSQYDDYDYDPKSQIICYEEDEDDQTSQLHVMEAHKNSEQLQVPQQQNLQEKNIKSNSLNKQTKGKAKKLDIQLSKRLKVESENASAAFSDEKVTSEEQKHLQKVHHEQQNQRTNEINQLAVSGSMKITSNSKTYSNVISQSEVVAENVIKSHNDLIGQNIPLTTSSRVTEDDDDDDEFDAFSKSVAMQLRKIPKADAYSLQVQFQLLLSQAKLRAMGKGSLDLSGFLGKT